MNTRCWVQGLVLRAFCRRSGLAQLAKFPRQEESRGSERRVAQMRTPRPQLLQRYKAPSTSERCLVYVPHTHTQGAEQIEQIR